MVEREAVSHELLLCLYALSSGNVDEADLVKAAQTLARFPEKSLSEILASDGRLDSASLSELQARVKRDLSRAGEKVGRHEEAAARSENDPNVTVDYPRSDRGDRLEAAESATSGTRRFEVLRPHARGGLGEVFLALDTELNRSVALKELPVERAHDPDFQARFLFEAEVTGSLEHPGIVPVYSLNRHADGRPFYAMRLLKGGTLRDAIDRFHHMGKSAEGVETRELAFRRLLRSVIDVCNAVAYAHSQGVVHRDLKPENVMLGHFGETLVVDWGIARLHSDARDDGAKTLSARHASADPSQTRPGSVIGTPRYMSPEQAEGGVDRVGPSSDIYSLGAILYCVLVGQDAFPDGDTPAVLNRVRRGIFLGPRRVRRSIDATLETICVKAMSLKPQDRHATALELADDLEKWLSDIRYRTEHEAAFIEVNRSQSRLALERAHTCFARDARNEGMLWLSRALEDAPAELQRVVRMSLSAWHVGAKLLERGFRHGAEVYAVDFSPEGRTLATAGANRTARLWDLATGSPLSSPLMHDGLVRAVTFHPDGNVVATADDAGLIRFWDAITGDPFGKPINCGSPVTAVCFSPEGARIAAANATGSSVLWDFVSRKPIGKWEGDPAPILAVSFSPDGSTLAVAREDGAVHLLDSTTGQPLNEPLAHDASVIRLAFDFAGGRLLTGSRDGGVRVWDIVRKIATIALVDQGEIRCLSFRADGEVFATSGDAGTTRLWDSSTGRPIGERLDHGARVDCLAFRPDGTAVATGGDDGKIRLWCAATGLPIGPALKHGEAVGGVVFSRDGGRLVSRGRDATVRCWTMPQPVEAEAERISYWVRMTTNLEFDEGDAICPMDGTTAWDIRRRLTDLGGAPLR